MSKQQFDNSDIELFNTYFTDFSGASGWIIKINGKPIKCQSGKSLWRTEGNAKSALKEHLHNVCGPSFMTKLACKYLKDAYHRDTDKVWKNWLDFAQERGILEFVELK